MGRKHSAFLPIVLLIVGACIGSSDAVSQQPEPAQVPAIPALLEASASVGPVTSREAQLEERVRQLEAMVNQLSN
jgi:hypothetical protein